MKQIKYFTIIVITCATPCIGVKFMQKIKENISMGTGTLKKFLKRKKKSSSDTRDLITSYEIQKLLEEDAEDLKNLIVDSLYEDWERDQTIFHNLVKLNKSEKIIKENVSIKDLHINPLILEKSITKFLNMIINNNDFFPTGFAAPCPYYKKDPINYFLVYYILKEATKKRTKSKEPEY